MGDDPHQSVVDRDLRAHDHANLFIVGGMVFPTAGVNPPTLTIAALALRAAAEIKRGLDTDASKLTSQRRSLAAPNGVVMAHSSS